MSKFISIPVKNGVAKIPASRLVQKTSAGNTSNNVNGSISGSGQAQTLNSWSGNISYNDDETKLGATNVQEAIGVLSGQKIDHPSTGQVGQILEIESVDENGKPKTYKAVDKPTGGGEVSDEQIADAVQDYLTENPPEVGEVVPHWAEFPRLINPARDIYNSVAMTKKQVLGTDGTLRHNLMIHGDLMTWTESTGVDYADKSGAAHVKLMGFFDYFGNGNATENYSLSKTDVYDVFPSGSDILGVDGNVIDTVVASSDSTLVDTGNGNYVLMAGCQGASSYHMVYRTVNYKARGTLTMGDAINVLTINGTEWDMTTLREDYHNKYSQLNTKVIKSGNYYYMTMVQGGVGIAVMKSADGKAWELHHHIPDTNCHLEACIGEVGWVSNNMPTCYIIARNNYGFGYVTLYAFKGIGGNLISKTFIPASSGRAMLDTVNNKDIYLTYSVNGRHNAVIAKIMPNNDGTSGVSIFETPKDIMSNYPVLFAGRSSLGSHTMWFGGTDGLNKKPSSVSFAYLWNENDDVLNAKNEQLKKVMFGTSVEVVQTLKSGTEIGSVGGTKLYAPEMKDIDINIDSKPTEGSTNPVSSGGVYEALKNTPSSGAIEPCSAVTIVEHTITADEVANVTEFLFTVNDYPKLAEYNHLYFQVFPPQAANNGGWYVFAINRKDVCRFNTSIGVYADIEVNGNYAKGWATNGNSTHGALKTGLDSYDSTAYGKGKITPLYLGGPINSVSLKVYGTGYVQEGEVITIKGYNF